MGGSVLDGFGIDFLFKCALIFIVGYLLLEGN